jgi:hypothetical protein
VLHHDNDDNNDHNNDDVLDTITLKRLVGRLAI